MGMLAAGGVLSPVDGAHSANVDNAGEYYKVKQIRPCGNAIDCGNPQGQPLDLHHSSTTPFTAQALRYLAAGA